MNSQSNQKFFLRVYNVRIDDNDDKISQYTQLIHQLKLAKLTFVKETHYHVFEVHTNKDVIKNLQAYICYKFPRISFVFFDDV